MTLNHGYETPKGKLIGMTKEDIDKRFDHHPPTGAKIALHQTARTAYKVAAHLVATLPAGREQSLAITALEESMFWANAAIARNPLNE